LYPDDGPVLLEGVDFAPEFKVHARPELPTDQPTRSVAEVKSKALVELEAGDCDDCVEWLWGEWLWGEWLWGEWLCGEWLWGEWLCGEWLCGEWLWGEWLWGEWLWHAGCKSLRYV
jgi:hypothetical protein